MTIEYIELTAIIGLLMAALKVIEVFISKKFGLERQISNHLTHKLEEMKNCEADNADRIIKAITDLHIDLIKEINRAK